MRPDKVEIFCESCKQPISASAAHRCQAVCPGCGHDSWHIQATYLARHETADGTSLALNALGLSILSNAGVEIGGPIPIEKRPINGLDIRDVSAATLCELVEPSVDPKVKLDAFVRLKLNEQFRAHRQQMEQRGQDCETCGVLFVLHDKKPWTMVGTCSKFCCAKKYGANDYAMIEDRVTNEIKQLTPELQQLTRDSQTIHVVCPACQHKFDLPRMYSGIQRKCPACEAKVKVP